WRPSAIARNSQRTAASWSPKTRTAWKNEPTTPQRTMAVHGRGTFRRRVPRDDLLPRVPDRRVPPAEQRPADALHPRRGDARRLARVGGRDAQAARGGGARRARPPQGGDPDRGGPGA